VLFNVVVPSNIGEAEEKTCRFAQMLAKTKKQKDPGSSRDNADDKGRTNEVLKEGAKALAEAEPDTGEELPGGVQDDSGRAGCSCRLQCN